ncbi:serine hydrolase domain-containing protein [uncultured Croceitalea sp.]|uniref:serine hydrolase domain-containing protein n=1 Tax=uncultured Croceitalea sp. TaxID=1798908 RepID=UPI0033060710
MRIFKFLSLLFIPLIGCTERAEDEKKHLEERISRIENRLQLNFQIKYGDSTSVTYYNIKERMKELGIPGVSIAVLNEGVVEWTKGYGMADSVENREVTPTTLFQAASISKPIAATRAHQLAEHGLIHIDSNVNKYLSSWKLPDNVFTENEKVTLRRMLNHSAGLTVWGFPGYRPEDTIPSIPEILNGKGNTDAVLVYKEPGESWRYSGGGYTIMQLMITDLEQKPFPEIMKQEVLNPLGMETSTFENPLPQEYRNRAAAGYNFDGTQVDGKFRTYPEMAAAGLWTTPSELILWGKEVQEILKSQKDGILKAETINEMLIPSEDDQGLGPYVLEHTFGHGGADEGFRAELVVWKETANAAVVMVNSNNGSIIREILMSIAKEYNLPGYEPVLRTYVAQSDEQLEKFIGTYDFAERGKSKIAVRESGLEITEGFFKDSVFLLPENDSIFFNKNTGTQYRFQTKEGSILGVEFSSVVGKKID